MSEEDLRLSVDERELMGQSDALAKVGRRIADCGRRICRLYIAN
ncbi:MAG: hypothetical protein WAN51_02540 [Alphaproteobacteria bacterium]